MEDGDGIEGIERPDSPDFLEFERRLFAFSQYLDFPFWCMMTE